MDDYHIKMQEIQELREAVKLKQINEELLEQLASSLRWLLHYAQKNNIDLPDKDKIILSVERAMEIADKIPYTPTTYQQPNTTPEDSTESGNAVLDFVIMTPCTGYRHFIQKLQRIPIRDTTHLGTMQ